MTVHHYPAITRVSEFLTFDYSSIFTGDNAVERFYALFAHPAVPFVSVLLYLLISNTIFDTIRKVCGLEPRGPVIQNFTMLHSAILAVYSGWTFIGSVRVVAAYAAQHGVYGAICDTQGHLWNDGNLGFWMTHFYISKFYEFIDTWIVVLKGRSPIFLQVYHHAGIVILMWGFVVTSNSTGLVILTFNSFIHTLMYSYYTLAAFGYQSPLKNYLTQAQIIQFILGIAITLSAHFIDSCQNEAQSFVLAAIQVYAAVLIYLFYQFYKSTYSGKKKDKTVKGATESNGSASNGHSNGHASNGHSTNGHTQNGQNGKNGHKHD
jgi:hypothetical protein